METIKNNTDFCYAGYSWRVVKNNRFVGYVVAMSETDAMRKAFDKFGSLVWVQRIASLT
jgi:hypothetical protein